MICVCLWICHRYSRLTVSHVHHSRSARSPSESTLYCCCMMSFTAREGRSDRRRRWIGLTAVVLDHDCEVWPVVGSGRVHLLSSWTWPSSSLSSSSNWIVVRRCCSEDLRLCFMLGRRGSSFGGLVGIFFGTLSSSWRVLEAVLIDLLCRKMSSLSELNSSSTYFDCCWAD